MNSENKGRYIVFALHFLLLTVLVIADRYTKVLATDCLKDGDSYVFIENFLEFTYVENRGAAWGVFSGKINFLMIITVLLMPLFIYTYIGAYRAKKYIPHKTKTLSVIMINMVFLLAGAIGNFIDRIKYGYVTDFLEVKFIEFPVFNIADCYITVGEIIFCVIFIFFLKENEFDIVFKGKKAIKEEGDTK